MISKTYVQTMARYNDWQNSWSVEAAGALSDLQRRDDRGAFFKSIHGTFNHVLWADRRWQLRFHGRPPEPTPIADSAALIENWYEFVDARKACDTQITNWAASITDAWLNDSTTWKPLGATETLVQPHA